jgi:preprotein translocase subunit SecG
MGYYLRLRFNTARLLIRYAFLIGYFLMVMLALMYLMVLTLWCIIGVLLSPSKMAPYAAAVITFVAHAASLFARLKKVSALHRITYESECCLAALGVVF